MLLWLIADADIRRNSHSVYDTSDSKKCIFESKIIDINLFSEFCNLIFLRLAIKESVEANVSLLLNPKVSVEDWIS